MRRRGIAGAGAAAVGAVTAVTALMLGTATGHAQAGPSEAYGVFVTSLIDPPQPYVQSTDGTEQTDSIVELPENPLLGLEVATVTAGDSAASAKLVGVEVLPGADLGDIAGQLPGFAELMDGAEAFCSQEQLPEQLPEELAALIPPQLGDELDPARLCAPFEAGTPAALSLDLITVECVGNEGTLEVVGLSLLGQEIEVPLNPEPNTEIPLGPLGDITFNKQATDDDGVFTIQAVNINLGGEFEIILASASCGQAAEEPPAPKPTPVTTELPVTG